MESGNAKNVFNPEEVPYHIQVWEYTAGLHPQVYENAFSIRVDRGRKGI